MLERFRKRVAKGGKDKGKGVKPGGKNGKAPANNRLGLETPLKTGISLRRDVVGKMWLSLDYYDRRLSKLDDYRQETFLKSYMDSSRQLNRSLVWIVALIIISYIAYAVRILNMAETAAAWIILVYLLFYLARHHRKENERLLRFLIDSESVPDYAKKR